VDNEYRDEAKKSVLVYELAEMDPISIPPFEELQK